MASSTLKLSRQNSLFLLPATIKLALWRFKQMWRFLFITWLGLLAMVVLICALPLFSHVTISADLRSVVATGRTGPNVMVQVASQHPTQTQIDRISRQIGKVIQQTGFNPYLSSMPRFSVETPPLALLQTTNTATSSSTPASTSTIFVDGYDLTQAAAHLTVTSGRLPQPTTDDSIEIAMSQRSATTLGLKVGTTFQTRTPISAGSQTWTVHLVGIIAPPASPADTFWSATSPFGGRGFDRGPLSYGSLTSLDVIKAKIATLQIVPSADNNSKAAFFNSFQLFWTYRFDTSHLDAENVDALSQQTRSFSAQLQNTLTDIPDVSFAFPYGSLLEALNGYSSQAAIMQILITFLLLLTLAIVLFLVSMLADMLVERQSAVIATLRSRGATRRHVFGAFIIQGFVISIAALLAGPFLALLLVRTIAQFLLTPGNQASLNVISSNPLQSVLDIKWYAIISVLVGLFVMILAIRRASKQDIVTLRRESSRTKRVPFWRRFNLDILLIVLILIGYLSYNYLWQSLIATQQISPTAYNLLQAAGFFAPPFVAIASLLLFLRLFPLILRLSTYLASRRRSASAVLAFAQMERAPRPAARIIVLLALAVASSTFLCSLIATKDARTTEAANFAVGADFSGPLTADDTNKTFAELKHKYSTFPGVLSATIAYSDTIRPDQSSPLSNNASGPIHIEAADADTYANTAYWPAQSPSIAGLTAQLRTHRTAATASNIVYAIVDVALWKQLNLTPNARFTLPMNSAGDLQIQFIALGKVDNIPTTYTTPLNPYRGVGLLVDYQSFATVYAKNSGNPLTPTEVFLHTKSDSATRGHIIQSFPGFQDRRQVAIDNQESNVHLDIIGVLGIAIGAALILALVGTLLSSWLNAASRRTNFAVARALGMAPTQIAGVLLWEQGLVYILAFLLGTGLGALLVVFASPIVSLFDVANDHLNDNQYDVPFVPINVPYQQLSILLASIMLVCLIALLLMARIVSRPSIGQTLRLNED